GRPLSEWLDIWERTGGVRTNAIARAPSPEAVIAIQTIGTNAFPTVSKWLTYEPSSFHRRLLSIADDLPLPDTQKHAVMAALSDRDAKSRRSMVFFMAFGSNATPMIPELTRLMKSTNSLENSRRAAIALTRIGIAALREIKEALADTN